ncbi:MULTISPECIES: SOS response-associated peptidase [Luteimonas]|uniref:SOS response-associated peptidase n=1 Tax=Luteimonas TaxID=83614 RepID=UPI000C7BD72B|nr:MULTISPECIES: SOS response-associated peptidase family protein [Luteimonas]
MRRFVQSFSGQAGIDGLPSRVTDALAAVPDRYNIAVRNPAAIVLDRGEGLQVEALDWGLIPRWSALPETKYTTVTARLARAATSRIFKRPWESQRCIVPMSGYYKWDRSRAPPHPWFIHTRDGAPLFAAGLWEHWERDTPHVLSFAVLTHPNPAIPAPLVPDGPLFLPADRIAEWSAGPRAPERFLADMPQPALDAYPVSPKIRIRDIDDYTLLEPVMPQAVEDDGTWLDDAFEDDGD